MERVGGDVAENISDFVDQTESIVLILKEGLEFRSDKLHNPSISKRYKLQELKYEPSINSIQRKRSEQSESRVNIWGNHWGRAHREQAWRRQWQKYEPERRSGQYLMVHAPLRFAVQRNLAPAWRSESRNEKPLACICLLELVDLFFLGSADLKDKLMKRTLLPSQFRRSIHCCRQFRTCISKDLMTNI